MAQAPTSVHGTLTQVEEVGVLLLGPSGIGKSECAMELVRRGHRLVADDVVLVRAGDAAEPIGESPDLTRHYVELRGIGIVHVPSLFGPESVVDRATIELVVRLVAWDDADIDRTGLDERLHRLGGFEVAGVDLPVAPGRNIATLVEVAARNHLLRQRGQSAAGRLDARVAAQLRRGSS